MLENQGSERSSHNRGEDIKEAIPEPYQPPPPAENNKQPASFLVNGGEDAQNKEAAAEEKEAQSKKQHEQTFDKDLKDKIETKIVEKKPDKEEQKESSINKNSVEKGIKQQLQEQKDLQQTLLNSIKELEKKLSVTEKGITQSNDPKVQNDLDKSRQSIEGLNQQASPEVASLYAAQTSEVIKQTNEAIKEEKDLHKPTKDDLKEALLTAGQSQGKSAKVASQGQSKSASHIPLSEELAAAADASRAR